MDTELPTKWYIRITENNREIVNNWKIKQKYNDSLLEIKYKTVRQDGSGSGIFSDPTIFHSSVEITTDEFIKHVLYQEPNKPIQEDFSYLIELFKKLKID